MKDGRSRKCSECSLTTTNVTGQCDGCKLSPPRAFKWYAVAIKPSKLSCTFYRKGQVCMRQAVAVQHGLRGMTGKAACAECCKAHRLQLNVGKGSFTGSHTVYKRGAPPSFAFAFRNKHRLYDAA